MSASHDNSTKGVTGREKNGCQECVMRGREKKRGELNNKSKVFTVKISQSRKEGKCVKTADN